MNHHRPIRSYVLRQGRLTPGQERAFETLWPRFGVEFSGQQIDLPSLFGNDHPVYLEIGFGNGDSLAQMAARKAAQEDRDRNLGERGDDANESEAIIAESRRGNG